MRDILQAAAFAKDKKSPSKVFNVLKINFAQRRSINQDTVYYTIQMECGGDDTEVHHIMATCTET